MAAVNRRQIVLFLAVAAAATAVDLWTKSLAFARLGPFEEYWLVRDFAGFQLSLNEGGLFGVGQGGQFWLAAFSVIAAVAILVWLGFQQGATDRVLYFTLALVLGGILGNLYDRLGLHGLRWSAFDPTREGPVYAVRDFVLLSWRYSDPVRRMVWPNFNVADSFLVLGAAILFFRATMCPSGGKTPAVRASV